ncbi:MAG: enoyl-CoA hydratase/isomerase family protein [Phycisphaerales bacterium]|nr:enoyl-CoA hydratase/isomerase family protein [Phycisphaerales bacterium]
MVQDLLPVELSTNADGAVIAVLTLDQPGRPVVVIDESLLRRLHATLGTLPQDLGGFVLASSAERAFVAGADLKSIMAMDDQALHRYLEYGAKVFEQIASLPCPTAAAIHSVVLGGGLELAMHCDGLVGLVDPNTKPYLVGLPEAGLKICPGWGGTNLLPARIDPVDAITMTANGRAMKSDQADELGLFDVTVTSRDELIGAAKAWVGAQEKPVRGEHPSRCISAGDLDEMKDALKVAREQLESAPHVDAVLDAVGYGIESGWSVALQCERDRLVALRHTEPAQDAINAFFNKGK